MNVHSHVTTRLFVRARAITGYVAPVIAILLASVLTATTAVAQTCSPFQIQVLPAQGDAFGYIPLSLFGGNTTIQVGDDEIFNLDVPAFVFAGETWTQVGISSNGYIVVGGSTGLSDNTAVNQQFPNAAQPNNVVAPFWTNLDPTVSGGVLLANVLTDGVASWLVLEWLNVAEFGAPANRHTFQIWLGINNAEDIQLAYGPNTGNGNGHLTVGAENRNGTSGGNYLFNPPGGPFDFTTLRVTTTGNPDLIPPVITLKNTPTNLWPPNHKYSTFNVSSLVASASDNCGGSLNVNDVKIARVSSDEAEDGPGDDGATLQDIVINNTCRAVQLRGERNGAGNGRIYTIELAIADASGNVGTASVQVAVPLNQAGLAAVLGPGPGYSVSCP